MVFISKNLDHLLALRKELLLSGPSHEDVLARIPGIHARFLSLIDLVALQIDYIKNELNMKDKELINKVIRQIARSASYNRTSVQFVTSLYTHYMRQ